MKRIFLLILAGALMAVFTGQLYAEQSLGDAARENRKSRKTKATKVYNNDNLPTNAPISMVGVVNPPEADSKTTQPGAATKDSDTNAKDTAEAKKDDQSGSVSTEAEARQKVQDDLKGDLDKQRAKVADLTRELDLLTREYRLRTAMYYSDAGYRLRAPQAWAEEDQKYRDKIAAAEQALGEAQSKLSDLEEAARKAGLPGKATEQPDSNP